MNELHEQYPWLAFLEAIAQKDVHVLHAKERSYKGSWQKRGGIGAFMMLARKWDRIEAAVQTANYDIFRVAMGDVREEGILDDIADLRRYLMLVEAMIVKHQHADALIAEAEARMAEADAKMQAADDMRCAADKERQQAVIRQPIEAEIHTGEGPPIPVQVPRRKDCGAFQFGNTMRCAKCGNQWEIDDPKPPYCKMGPGEHVALANVQPELTTEVLNDRPPGYKPMLDAQDITSCCCQERLQDFEGMQAWTCVKHGPVVRVRRGGVQEARIKNEDGELVGTCYPQGQDDIPLFHKERAF